MGAVTNSGLIDHKIIDPLVTLLVKDKKLITAIAKHSVQQKFNKLRRLVSNRSQTGPKSGELKIIMSAKGVLNIKRQNMQIDQQTTNSADNPFRTTNTRHCV